MCCPHAGPGVITNLAVEHLYELLNRVGYELLSKSHVMCRMLHIIHLLTVQKNRPHVQPICTGALIVALIAVKH